MIQREENTVLAFKTLLGNKKIDSSDAEPTKCHHNEQAWGLNVLRAYVTNYFVPTWVKSFDPKMKSTSKVFAFVHLFVKAQNGWMRPDTWRIEIQYA